MSIEEENNAEGKKNEQDNFKYVISTGKFGMIAQSVKI